MGSCCADPAGPSMNSTPPAAWVTGTWMRACTTSYKQTCPPPTTASPLAVSSAIWTSPPHAGRNRASTHTTKISGSITLQCVGAFRLRPLRRWSCDAPYKWSAGANGQSCTSSINRAQCVRSADQTLAGTFEQWVCEPIHCHSSSDSSKSRVCNTTHPRVSQRKPHSANHGSRTECLVPQAGAVRRHCSGQILPGGAVCQG